MSQFRAKFRPTNGMKKAGLHRNKKNKMHSAMDRLVPLRTGNHNPYNRFHYGCITCPEGAKVDILSQCSQDFFQREYIRRLQRIWSLPNFGDRVFSFSNTQFSSRSKMTKHWLVTPRRRPKIPSPREALDLPHFKGDFYYNQLDWGPNDCVAAWLTGSVHIWDACDSTAHKLKTFETDCFCSAIKFDTTGELLAIGTSKSQVEFWSIKNAKMYDSMYCFCKAYDGCSINSVEWHPTSKNFFLSGCSNGYVCTMNMENIGNRCLVYKVHNGQIALVRSSPNGTHVALCGETSVCILKWNNLTLDGLVDISMDFPTRALAWHPHHAALLAVGFDYGIIIYNATSGAIIATWNSSVPCTVDALSFSHRTGELVVSIWLLQEGVSEAGEAQRRLLVLSSLDHVSDWLVRGGEDLGRTISMMWSRDGRYIAIASSDESLLIWNFLGDRKSKRSQIQETKSRSIFQHFNDSNSHMFCIR